MHELIYYHGNLLRWRGIKLTAKNLTLPTFSYRRVGSTRYIFSVINGVLSATVRFFLSICSVSMAALLSLRQERSASWNLGILIANTTGSPKSYHVIKLPWHWWLGKPTYSKASIETKSRVFVSKGLLREALFDAVRKHFRVEVLSRSRCYRHIRRLLDPTEQLQRHTEQIQMK